MISFLSGVTVAVVLAVVMLVGMETLYIPTELKYDGPNLHLNDHLIDETVGGEVAGAE
ncbi:hypothetical protein SAMN04488020_104139 [Palleronia marisminoris]|uniref:Uncharacterized protein n=1 Tax=Palleronia marisminoris TaxID=315423 RepID=A0A1Y5SJE7_9RHOB|nr:hypothetical protein [Palleronia marisminoris]SFG83446.1 hypothetical protein SAMN04488020_104139 [Palleronia marisminoris]SLN40998.1 hypothetical protein PAM7066_01762 [Palleronia marisminoris]